LHGSLIAFVEHPLMNIVHRVIDQPGCIGYRNIAGEVQRLKYMSPRGSWMNLTTTFGPQARKAGQEDRNNGHVVLERENGDAVTKLGKTAAGGARSLGKYQQITTLVKQPTGVLERF
jgi:hypothetical protein